MAEKKEKISIEELASSFIRTCGFQVIEGIEKPVMRFWRGDFYQWSGGVYGKLGKDMMESRMVCVVSSMGQTATTDLMNNLRLNIKAGMTLDDKRVPDTWLTNTDNIDVPTSDIVLDNGILTFVGNVWNITPLTPDFFCLGKLPYRFDPEAKCPRWDLFLNEVTRGDNGLRRLLQQWAGYLLMPGQKYQSFLLLIGEAGTGKGTFARAMKAMLGDKNCSDIPLRRFTDKFSLYLTYGKKMNVAGDAEQELSPQVEAIIKTWTGEDGLDYERKYAEGFTANPTAKLMILTNDFPTFTDKSMGTWRRLKIVPFHRDDPMIVEKGLDKTIASEMPGVLNWALEGLKDLEQNGGFVVPEVSKRLMEMHKEESNPARMFLKENYEYDPEYPFGVSRQSLYDGYARWCNAKGYQKLNDRNFGKEIRREFPQVMESRVGGKKSDTRYRIHKGLKVSPGAEVLRLLSQKR